MSRIRETFEHLKKENKKALIPFITAGDPDISTTCSLVLELEKNGADLIELGIPFSDPLADGPTIQRSYLRALEKNISLKQVLDTVKKLREKTSIPIILMSSYNLIISLGEKKIIRDAAKAGVNGLIIPDLPVEEADDLLKLSQNSGVDIIFLLAPTSKNERIKIVCEKSRAFIYYISVAGITGERKSISGDIKNGIKKIRKFSDLPIAVGFGISTPSQAAEVASCSDGVIVGSANMKIVEQFHDNSKLLVEKVGKFTQSLKKKM